MDQNKVHTKFYLILFLFYFYCKVIFIQNSFTSTRESPKTNK